MLRTFKATPNYKEFKKICSREGVDMGDKINEFIEDYIKVHANGNPQYQIDQFEDPNFSAYPAFKAPYQNRRDWVYNLKQVGNNNQINEFRFALQEWVGLFEEYLGRL